MVCENLSKTYYFWSRNYKPVGTMSNQMFNAAFDAVTETHRLKDIKELFLAGPKTIEDALKINKAFQDHFYHEVDYRCLYSLISTRDFAAIANVKGALHALLTHLQECRKEYLAEKTHADSFWNTFIKKELPQPVLDRLFFIACEVNERVDREYTRSFADFVLYTIYSISTEQKISGVSEYIDWWCFDDCDWFAGLLLVESGVCTNNITENVCHACLEANECCKMWCF